MKNFLEDLWYNYQNENTKQMDAEEKELIKQLVCYEEQLRGHLNSEQTKILEAMESIHDSIGANGEKKAFIAEIRFAAKFLYEAFKE